MAQVDWSGFIDIDYKAGLNVQPGTSFDPLLDRAFVTTPDLHASQFDAYQAGSDLAFVKVRNIDGSQVAASDLAYFYIPGMTLGQVGLLPGQGGGLANFGLANGSRYIVGDGTTDTAADDLGNLHDLPVDGQAGHYALGLGGADSLGGGGGWDRLLGNLGNDLIWGRGGNDSAYGGQDDDTVFGGNGDDLLHGDRGNDLIFGGNGDDRMFGSIGRDLFHPGVGRDVMFGGKDNDDFDLTAAVGFKYVSGDLGDDHLLAAGMDGWLVASLGPGNDTAHVSGHLGELAIDFGDGNNDGEIDFGAYGGYLIGGADRDVWDVHFQPAQLDGYGYGLFSGDGDDLVRLFGQVEGNPFGGLYFGDGADFLDVGDFFGSDRIGYSLGAGDDSVVSGSGGVFDLGTGDNHISAGAGRIELQLRYEYQLLGETKFGGFVVGRDEISLSSEAFQDFGELIGYRGTGADITNDRNFVVLDDMAYGSISQAIQALPMAYTQRQVDAFFLILDDEAELWYTPDLSNPGSAMMLLGFSDYLSLGSLGSLGSLSGTDPLSFHSSASLHLAPPDPPPPPLPEI